MDIPRELHDALAKKLADEGKIIEAGFVGMRLAIIPADATPAQVADMRAAFMGGAQHLFASIMAILSPDADPTAGDLRRMSLIDAELRAFADELKLRVVRPGGSA